MKITSSISNIEELENPAINVTFLLLKVSESLVINPPLCFEKTEIVSLTMRRNTGRILCNNLNRIFNYAFLC